MMQIHPIVKLFSAAMLLAAAALIVPSPLIDSVQADPPPECGDPWELTQCEEQCCDNHETCVWGAEAAYDDCVEECEGDPVCEDDCEVVQQYNLESCDFDFDWCWDMCQF